MSCQRRRENPDSPSVFTIDSGCGDVLRLIQPGAPQGSNMQRDMQWDVTCCTVTSASLLAILCLQHCDAFSTRKEHHDQSTDSRSGGRPPDHSEKRCAPHHRLSA